MNLILLDTPQSRKALSPFADTRALSKLRIGIHTIEEKWCRIALADFSPLTAPYLRNKFPYKQAEENICINSTILPTPSLWKAITNLKLHEKLIQKGIFIAAHCAPEHLELLQANPQAGPFKTKEFEEKLIRIEKKWDLFSLNKQEIESDFAWVSNNNRTQAITDPYTIIYNQDNLFVSSNVSTKAAILNAEKGPIYLGPNVTIEEGAIIKGPIAICEGTTIAAGAVINNATTIGPYAKVGGEVSNTIILGYSNKVHAGFMGNSIIGEWCNLGGGSITSNLRLNYGSIKVWNQEQNIFEDTALQLCGLFMGDYVKCGINTMFNAGTTVGIATCLFGAGFFEKYIPAFSWGSPGAPMQVHLLDKALETAEKMMARRQVTLTHQDKEILTHVFDNRS